jgi:DNA-directed RNA polymerase sigma subunit (sigma70/sigma32)
VRVPRRLQELVLEINHVQARLTQQFGRHPSVAETATHAGVTQDQVVQAAIAARAYRPLSLFTPVGGIDGPRRSINSVAPTRSWTLSTCASPSHLRSSDFPVVTRRSSLCGSMAT